VCEHPVKGNGAIDILAKKPGEHVAIEVETGKSDIKGNLNKIREERFDRIIVIATSPTATAVCQKVIDSHPEDKSRVEQLSWLDIS
jgi:predicted RecB family endonuclease